MLLCWLLIMLSVQNMIWVIMLIIDMLSDICWVTFAECHYAECHYAECHYAECLNAEFRGTQWIPQTLLYYYWPAALAVRKIVRWNFVNFHPESAALNDFLFKNLTFFANSIFSNNLWSILKACLHWQSLL